MYLFIFMRYYINILMEYCPLLKKLLTRNLSFRMLFMYIYKTYVRDDV